MITDNMAGSSSALGGDISTSSSTLNNCLVVRNSVRNRAGSCLFSSSLSLTNCTIADNLFFDLPGTIYGNSVSVTSCIIFNEGYDLSKSDTISVTYSCVQGGYPGEGNINASPFFVDTENGDYRLQNGSPCIDRGLVSAAATEDIEGNSRPGSDGLVDIGAYESSDEYEPGEIAPQVYRVRLDAAAGGDGLTWETALGSVREALQRSTIFDEIWVAEGRYFEGFYLESGVGVYGGFQGSESEREERDWNTHPTVLDASGTENRTVRAFFVKSATLDGFTITSSSASPVGRWGESSKVADGGVDFFMSTLTLSNCLITGNWAFNGGGVGCSNSPVIISDCVITGNSSLAYNYGRSLGGGVCCFYCSPTLIRCTISNNSATAESTSAGGGGLYCEDSSPELINCTINGNESFYGGGVYCQNSPVKMTDCSISGNVAIGNDDFAVEVGIGGGLYSSLSSPILLNCLVSQNSAANKGGGFCLGNGSPQVINCLITDNSAMVSGGGLFCRYPSSLPQLTNCTIAGNSSSEENNSIYCESNSSPSFTNCILWNPGSEILVDSATPTVQYSCVQDGYAGEGNIDDDPMFVDEAKGDYHLQAGSPCIDAGNHDVVQQSNLDLDGKWRIWDGDGDGLSQVDMGAYEYESIHPVAGDTNRDGLMDPRDPFFFARWWQSSRNETNFMCDVVDDQKINEQDLLKLMQYWK